MEIVEKSLYLILFVLIIIFFLLLISKIINTKKLKNILNNNNEESKTDLDLITEKKENFFYENASMEEIKEHLSLLNKTKKDFFNSDSFDKEVVVDFVIGSQVLKNWSHNSLVSEDNKVILKKVYEGEKIIEDKEEFIKTDLEVNANENINKFDKNKSSLIFNSTEEQDTQLINEEINIVDLKNKIVPNDKYEKKNKKEIIEDEDKLTNEIIEEKNEDIIYNEEMFYNIYLNQELKILENILIKVIYKIKEKEYSLILDDEYNINVNLKDFLNTLYVSIKELLEQNLTLSFKYNEEIIINELMIDFFIKINKKFEKDFFKINELKNKKHIAKKYLFIFNENSENEILIQDYYLSINSNEKLKEISSNIRVPDKIIKQYHQIKMYLMNKNKVEEKPF